MLELKNICTGYGKENILNGVTVSFEKGEITGIIGTNGCGKSTLLKAMLGILPLSSGEIIFDGMNISSMKRNDIARKAAYLSQGKSTPDMTVEQLVLHGRFPYLSYPRRYREEDRKIARNAMETAGLMQLADKPLSALSGGMRQNAYIAMALAQDTDYILLDEPTTYLDISHQLQLMRLLKRLAEMGKGIVTVMHDLPMAFEFSNKILAIQNGRVAAFGAPSEICSSPIIGEIFGIGLQSTGDNRFYYNYSGEL